MQLYNSLTHTKEDFVPNEAGKVSLYTCGPTVYHYAHIGNLRTYMMEDILDRYLRYIGYDVTRVMNITDVGQRIVKLHGCSTFTVYYDFFRFATENPNFPSRRPSS